MMLRLALRGLAVGWLGLLSARAAPSLPLGGEAYSPAFEARIEASLTRSLDAMVIYKDTLGEGWGHWDSTPRYRETPVNCLTWLQRVITGGYAKPGDEEKVMDRLRYYYGQVGYGMRKHYTDHALALDPGPFRLVPFTPACAPTGTAQVTLEPRKFAAAQGYSCPLYKEERTQFEATYVAPAQLIECVRSLKPGFVIAFGVPSESYLERWGKKSGPMGLVHAFLIDRRKAGDEKIYHASALSGRVEAQSLADFMAKNQHTYRGHVFYELSEKWNPLQPWPLFPIERNAVQKILDCEAKLPAGAGADRDL